MARACHGQGNTQHCHWKQWMRALPSVWGLPAFWLLLACVMTVDHTSCSGLDKVTLGCILIIWSSLFSWSPSAEEHWVPGAQLQLTAWETWHPPSSASCADGCCQVKALSAAVQDAGRNMRHILTLDALRFVRNATSQKTRLQIWKLYKMEEPF